MNNWGKFRTRTIAGPLVGLMLVIGGAESATAYGDEMSPQPPPGLSAEQQAAVKNLQTPLEVSGRVDSDAGGVRGTAKCSTKSASNKLYRGSFLMWSEDTMIFYYRPCEQRILSSSITQRAGYVFPNISKAKGAQRVYAA